MKKARVKELRGEEWRMDRDLMLKEGKIYVPKNIELRAEVIWLYYDILAAGYRGQWKTVELVMRNY